MYDCVAHPSSCSLVKIDAEKMTVTADQTVDDEECEVGVPDIYCQVCEEGVWCRM